MTFVARYRSACLACDEWICAGETVKWVDGVVVHDNCDAVLALRPTLPPCEHCFTVPSVSGDCLCEDVSPEWTLS